MNIQTMYNIGQKVYFISHDRILFRKICELKVTVLSLPFRNKTTYMYRIGASEWREENEIFGTLEHLRDEYAQYFKLNKEEML
jgi:hypothetical protein